MAVVALLFLFGIAIGSFLNVVILRYDGERFFNFGRLGGRSACLGCRGQLRWYELVPVVSFIIQGGKCRLCRARISWQYPVVEILTGGAFVISYLYFSAQYSFPYAHPHLWLMVVGWTVIFVCMIALSVVDVRMMLIPDELTAIIAAVGVMFGFANSGSFLGNYTALFPQFAHPLISHVIGGIAGFTLLGAITLVSRGKAMGMGDVKLAGAMGLVLGFPDIYFALALGFLLGGVFSAGLLVRMSRYGMKTMVPFGPFLVLGFFAFVFFGHSLVEWYVSLI